MSEPTAAAMRAVRSIGQDSSDRATYCMSAQTDRIKAEIIDRETGLPELIAALRRIYAMDNGQDLLNIGRQLAHDALRKAGEL